VALLAEFATDVKRATASGKAFVRARQEIDQLTQDAIVALPLENAKQKTKLSRAIRRTVEKDIPEGVSIAQFAPKIIWRLSPQPVGAGAKYFLGGGYCIGFGGRHGVDAVVTKWLQHVRSKAVGTGPLPWQALVDRFGFVDLAAYKRYVDNHLVKQNPIHHTDQSIIHLSSYGEMLVREVGDGAKRTWGPTLDRALSIPTLISEDAAPAAIRQSSLRRISDVAGDEFRMRRNENAERARALESGYLESDGADSWNF
jgi:hypothetical protein